MNRMHKCRRLTLILFAVALVCGASAAVAQNRTPEAAHIRYLDNGMIKIGIDLDLGGAITYLSRSGSDANMINSFDWGRQIQMSNYSGPIPFEPGGKKPMESWAGLGWNPIQSGDSYGNRSRVVSFKSSGHNCMIVRCIPMQWPLNKEPGECEFECRLRLDGMTVHVDCIVSNHRADQTQYDGRDQELPAIYTNGPWYRLMTYEGDSPFTGGDLTQAPAVFPWTGWRATENWAALVDENGDGVGVFEPGVSRFIGGFAGKPGRGGPKDGPTGYIAPLQVDILDANITYRYSYTLVVGNIASIRYYAYRHRAAQTPPVYRFSRDRAHWRYFNAVDTGWPIRGELKVSLAKSNPQLIGPAGFWKAADAPMLCVMAAFPEGIESLRVFWTRTDSDEFSEKCVSNFEVKGDSHYHEYTFDMAKNPEYSGLITRIRLDPETAGLPGSYLRVKSIGFCAPAH